MAENPAPIPASNPNAALKDSSTSLTSIVRPWSQSSTPVWALSSLFFATSVIPPRPGLPPIVHRLGFGAIFAGAGYVLSTGDTRNGSGISTAWSLIYLFLNFRKSLKAPRHPISLALTAATLASSTIYGSEYFVLQEDEE
ncbi:hypothetical protein CERSUDRAFT_91023 [Gelatoporia subvermispora B]|uniref:Uncharacterized protein n=1 Tax=Ceriporiopsis subvermispora (strain B) TaxID=914234 RepID=M2RN61_CERS8|nr:hypothetical protein CERSUDRAFT_91023 [Gelatoporia subvermispora B]